MSKEFQKMDEMDFVGYAGASYGDMICYEDNSTILITRNTEHMYEVHVDILTEDLEKQSYYTSYEAYESPADAIAWVNSVDFPFDEAGVQTSGCFECIIGDEA